MGLGVLEEDLEVGLVPLAGLGRRLEGVGLAAEGVVALGALVAGAVGLTAGLAPDEGVGELVAGLSGGADAEARAVHVAPVAPLLPQARHGVPAGVHDRVVRVSRRLERRAECLDVDLLVLALVPLRILIVGELAGRLVPVSSRDVLSALLAKRCCLAPRLEPSGSAWVCDLPGVPAGDVGSDTTDLAGAAGGLVDLSKLLGTGLEVVVPAEPTAVAGVDVHDDVGQVEGLERVCNTILIASLGLLAGRQVDVGHQVRQRVRLDDEREGRVRVRLEELGNDWNIALSVYLIPELIL